jgi:hypothetical protein
MTIKFDGTTATDAQLTQFREDLIIQGAPRATVWNSEDPDTPGIWRKAELRGKFTTLLHPDTGKFGFGAVIGNGTTYLASTFDDGTNDDGITGIIERVDDSTFIGDGTAQAPAANSYVWKLIITPTHHVTNGHPRVQLTSYFLPLNKTYEAEFKFRLHQPGTQGWNNITINPYSGGLFHITNESADVGGSDFGANQDVSSGPFALMLDGNKIYPLFRGLDPEMGSDPTGTYDTIDFGFGDMHEAMERSPIAYPIAIEYTTVRIRFHLDHRSRKDGGRGYIEGWCNHRKWFSYHGPTIHPLMADTGTHGRYLCKLGLYDTAGPSSANGTDNQDNTNACSIERSLWIQGYRIMEVAE